MPKKKWEKPSEEAAKRIKEAAMNGRIESAPQSEIEKIPVDFLTDFFQKVIGIGYWDCYITDESSLYDFPEEPSDYKDRIKKEYGGKIKYDKKLKIVDIVKNIKKNYK